MGTVRVPGHIREPAECSVTYGHRKGAQAHTDTGWVHGHIWKLEWSPGTYGQWKVLGYTRAPLGCAGTYGLRKGAQAHMGTGMVNGHI